MSKSSYRCQSVFADLLRSLCFRQADRNKAAGSHNADDLGRHCGLSAHSDSGLAVVAPTAAMNSRRPGNIGTGSAGGIGQAAITAVAGAHEQAETLKLELERVKSGLTLLAQSMEKLQETVRVDSRCCGAVAEVCASVESSVARSTSSRFRVSMSGRRSSGYDRVNGLIGEDDDHNGGPGPGHGSVISPLGYSSTPMNANGRNGHHSGGGGRVNSLEMSNAGTAKFTIESEDADDN